ncbi:hypothetical protein HBI56_191920 [Parastagonospora nodorum]|uniref:Uncharacterized protein n=2 Tax=Phaeosphaeria nodorum (strain SN15 / ATCC MYA-4574 / FGSC 10173) TaxID=321614 RepID=A0A7U2NPY5_PHANO|nr:hypothetical protein SNOG_14717 [Parastagonospora nodorum SN15]KAH3908156.1 hypothetical protein HBH56_178420 [Parastagonospora nodorum]EAT77909.1 hypothetical protein SNOG_14717 [Parastagonospora nodorum SN15]KAH3931864.1 hypothetical protein HBH54_091400 [Parastagonospora nodorum]KAH3939605.1 hypothetical protein HBH53_233040 [Parastagonospora nodorum]KAH3964432.1 hypothetical protein HBH52_212340 [Parastagonospora nodorum]
MSSNNRSKRRQARAPRGYVAELTPEGQVNKVIADIKNLKDGDDFRSWSASARKELTPSLVIPLQVGPDETSRVYIPKQALLVASPVARNYFQQNSTLTTAKFTHKDIYMGAMKDIAKWLKAACLEAHFPELIMPEDIKEFMELRLTAHTLGMERYVEHFDYYYIDDIDCQRPSLAEIMLIVDYTRKDDDPILVALANRLGYLCKHHKIPKADEEAIVKLLLDPHYGRLLAAVKAIAKKP